MTERTRGGRWWQDPLVHFVALGLGAFAVHRWIAPAAPETAIVVSAPVVRGLELDHIRRTGNAPSPQEVAGLVDRYVRNEILYREALTQGLDRGDIVVRRRLVQKMEFLLENLDPVPEPTDAELQTHLDAHPDRFAVPERVSLVHVFVSRERHGAAADAEAHRLRERLQAGEDPSALGEPFVHGATFAARTPAELARIFGDDFVAPLGACAVGAWSAPIRSPFGVHLVQVTHRDAGVVPPLSQVRTAVARDWTDTRRAALNTRAFAALRGRYDVRIEAAPATEVAAIR